MIRALRTVCFVGFAISASACFAQAWIKPYEAGLRAAKAGSWSEARSRFMEAVKNRPMDTDKVSVMGGSVADRRPWRNGAPYSPNFGIAYCNFKLASSAPDQGARTQFLNDAITGFSDLLSKGQESIESLIFLAASYSALNNTKKASDVQTRLSQVDQNKAFKIDREIIAEEDIRAMQGATVPVGPSGGDPRPGVEVGGLPRVGIGNAMSVVPILETKFALLIAESKTPGLPFAENDVDSLKEALMKHAGYGEANIVVLKNVSSETIMQQAKTLAARMPDGGILFLFYAGAGVNDPNSGHDYLAGSDTPEMTSFQKMVPKLDLYAPFVSKGTSIFTFYEVDRPINNLGRYFGMEIPQAGRIAQSQGNMPGESAYGTVVEGRLIGVYAFAMTQVMAQMRGQRIPLLDFAWNTFSKVRKGSPEVGGGAQTPTLPVVISMTTNARF